MMEEKQSFVVPYDSGLRLQEVRRRRGMSQQQAAMRLGIGRASISAYECGIKFPRMEVLRRIGFLYRISLDELMGLEPPSPFQGLSKEQEELVLSIIEAVKRTPRWR